VTGMEPGAAVDGAGGQLPTHGRVLLIERESADLRRMEAALRTHHDVEVATTGQRGLRFVREQRFDAVVMELSLPDVSGLSVLRILHQHEPDLPLIVVTARPWPQSAVEAIDLGAIRTLVEPIEQVELDRVVEQACRRHEQVLLDREALRSVRVLHAVRPTVLASSFERAMDSLHLVHQPVVCLPQRVVRGWEARACSREPLLSERCVLIEAARLLGREVELRAAVRSHLCEDVERLPIDGDVFLAIDGDELADESLFSGSGPLASIAHRVILELTGAGRIEGIDQLRARIFALRRLGFRVAVDDLAASPSLATLARIEPEVVKLGVPLVRSIDREPVKRRLVGVIHSFCRQLGISLIAQGVETREELLALRLVGCQLFQGSLFARPAHPLPAVSWQVAEG
jgi:EAL domain-containing protein (putative c-di-GMP-specific phosphodiesterase class I)